MKKEKKLLLILAILITILFSIILMEFIIISTIYVHEGGHIVFGLSSNLINGRSLGFHINNWIPGSILFSFIKAPQQTHLDEGDTLVFRLGGSLLVLILYGIVSLFLSYKTKNSLYILLMCIFLYIELIGNFICGTDNYLNNPLSLCNNWFVKSLFDSLWIVPRIFLFMILFMLLYSIILKGIKKVLFFNNLKITNYIKLK